MFKVGDKVRISGYMFAARYQNQVGVISVIESDTSKYNIIEFPNDVRQIFNNSDLVKINPKRCKVELVENETPTKETQVEETFTKHDSQKPATELLRPDFLLGVAEALGFGAKKYSPLNWLKCDNPERFYAAAMRHLLAYKKGEKLDPESGLNHLYHAAASIMFVSELERIKEENERSK